MMETIDGHSRHRTALAALNRLDMDKINRDGADGHRKMPPIGLSISTAPLLSPATAYPGPPPPYSCPSSATPSNIGALDYLSPPSSRRTTVDDKAQGSRQSLPSIQEALGGDGNMPFSTSNMVPPPSATSRIAPPTSSFGPGPSLVEAPPGPPNPFSQGSAVGQISENEPYLPRPVKHPDHLSEPARSQPAFPPINPTDAPPAILPNFSTQSPKSRSACPVPPNTYNQSPHLTQYTPPSETSPRRCPSFQAPHSLSTVPSDSPPSTFRPPPDYSRFNPGFKFDNGKPYIPRSHPTQPYSDSVKRHLDIFDMEMALNDVTDGSSRALEFSRMWSQRAHHRQRAAQLPESLPGVPELDDLMRLTSRVLDALGSIKEAVIAQHHAAAEEQARAFKREHYDDELASFSGEFKENGTFTSGDSKKRRGKAAPPGRCHSCNRAETPEWRRGPDGARTLCNACGLHYAKLTRKMAVNKNAALSGSSLRPKNSEATPAM